MRRLALRVFEGVVLLLALYALVAVPVGRRTLVGHLAAIWATPAAQHARDDVVRTVRKLWARRSIGPADERPAR